MGIRNIKGVILEQRNSIQFYHVKFEEIMGHRSYYTLEIEFKRSKFGSTVYVGNCERCGIG